MTTSFQRCKVSDVSSSLCSEGALESVAEALASAKKVKESVGCEVESDL